MKIGVGLNKNNLRGGLLEGEGLLERKTIDRKFTAFQINASVNFLGKKLIDLHKLVKKIKYSQMKCSHLAN